MRLFVFHHAGGSHLAYRDWPGRFPADWDVRPVDAPGRGLLSDRPALDAAPLPVPLSVYGGKLDAVAPPHRLAGWAERATPFLGLRLFDGGHFYFQPDPTALTLRIAEDVRRALDLTGAARATPR